MAENHETAVQNEELSPEYLRQRLSEDHFSDWYQERQYRKNIQNGTPYFNGSGHVPNPERHSPSKLLQCHRKTVYKQYNAPAEQPDPDGIFWFGSQFEEEIAFPFIEQAVTGPNTYVRNTMWVDFTIGSEVGELRIKGATDPVIVDGDSTPVLPTEIKTTKSVESKSLPNRHHKAQIHAYMAGLSEKYDQAVNQGVLMYCSRSSLDTKFFYVEFDQEFWTEAVLEWAIKNTEYRLNKELPPADPEYDWECEFCSYQERCGEGDSAHQNMGTAGFVPGYNEYPREKVVEYLELSPDHLLTPTLADKHPDLAQEYTVRSWYCPECSSTFDWDSGYLTAEAPLCSECVKKDRLTQLQLKNISSELQANQDESQIVSKGDQE